MEVTLVVWMGCNCDQCLYKRQVAGDVVGEDKGPKEPWSQLLLLPALLAGGEGPRAQKHRSGSRERVWPCQHFGRVQ